MAEPAHALVSSLPPPAKRKRLARVPTAAWLAIVLAFVAFVGYLAAMGGTKGTLVAVAAHDLAAGMPVGTGDFRFVSVDAEPDVMANLVAQTAMASVAGQVTARPLHEDELIQRSALITTTVRQRAISIPTEPSHAVAGSLRRGDVVDLSDASGDTAVWVAVGVQVLDVSGGDSGRLGGIASKYSVTVGVSDAQALAVAEAIAQGKMELVRSTGAPTAAVSPPTTMAMKR